jgi:ribosomal protein S18 acetylase RimI-like enzyme
MLERDRERYPPISMTLQDRQVKLALLAVGDAEALGDFYAAQPRATYRFYCPHPLTRENAALVAAKALSPTWVALIAKDAHGTIVGYASYRWESDDSRASTFGICIRPAYRGVGLGQALSARLFEIAADVGPPVMSLTVQKANLRALALYRKMGFRVVREQMRCQVHEFPPEPEYYMERSAR